MQTTMSTRTQPVLCLLAIATLTIWLGHALPANAQDGTTRKDTQPAESNPSKNDVEATNRFNTRAIEVGYKEGLLKKSVLQSKANSNSTNPTAPTNDDDSWHFEVKPYLWLAALDGTLRVGNQTAQVNASAGDILGMLDFAAAVQVEAIKGKWRIMFDENYVNLGTTGTGPAGLANVQVEPTINIFEFGASYTFASVPNEDATPTEPLPPVFAAEVLGGGRFFHLGLGLQPANAPPVEGSRNLLGPFVGARLKGSPHKAVTIIGKFTVGGSGAGSNFAWSAEGLVDLRLRKQFSLFGGYRVLGMNADQPANNVGFDGQMRGLILGATIYR